MSKKNKKLKKKIEEENSSFLLNDLMNFNEIFRKNLTYDDIKSHQKSGFHPHSRKRIFGKTIVGVISTLHSPPPFFRPDKVKGEGLVFFLLKSTAILTGYGNDQQIKRFPFS